jgi:hypothetical protein
MSERKSAFIKVDELLPQITVEQAADFYGISLLDIRQVGDEIRMRCFLACGRTAETGDRAIAIQANNPVKPWKCHIYGCQKGGNLVGLCDLMKRGENAGGRPRGQRFKEIAADLAAMAGGEAPPARAAEERAAAVEKSPAKPPVNVPLALSENERARELVHLDEQFVTDVAAMPPEASAYFRRRPFLTPEVCQTWKVGYLPQSAKSLLRGKIVYGYHSPTGELLTWFGRDPRYEQKLAAWKTSDRSEPDPMKTQFVKGFHRGLELYGESAVREAASEGRRSAAGAGLILVEGPNDAIRLHTLGEQAVAACSNTLTREQAERAAKLARDVADGTILLLLDCDEEGERGSQQALALLAEYAPVRLGWSGSMHAGRYKDRQPESLSADDWRAILQAIVA